MIIAPSGPPLRASVGSTEVTWVIRATCVDPTRRRAFEGGRVRTCGSPIVMRDEPAVLGQEGTLQEIMTFGRRGAHLPLPTPGLLMGANRGRRARQPSRPGPGARPGGNTSGRGCLRSPGTSALEDPKADRIFEPKGPGLEGVGGIPPPDRPLSGRNGRAGEYRYSPALGFATRTVCNPRVCYVRCYVAVA
jgi:hypothetical protein